MSFIRNDTFCRALLFGAHSLKTNSSEQKCGICLDQGCSWCKRDSKPFCWSGKAADLASYQDPYNSCTSDYVTSPGGKQNSDSISAKCSSENGVSIGTVVALLIWTIILICCVGACCFAIWYVAYNRGKRHQMVHVDNWNAHPTGGHYIAGAQLVPYSSAYQGRYEPTYPVQTEVVLAYNNNDPNGPPQHQQQYYYPQADSSSSGDQAGGNQKPVQIPVAIATPI